MFFKKQTLFVPALTAGLTGQGVQVCRQGRTSSGVRHTLDEKKH
jgi:hypothetical protein